MTDAEKDAAWRSLPEKVKEQFANDYSIALQAHSLDPNNARIDAHIKFLEECFGKHNISASEEEKPKEENKVRKINVGDIVRVKRDTPCTLYNNMPYAFVDMPFFVTEIEEDCDNNLNDTAHLRNGSTYLNIHPHWLQKEDVHHKWEKDGRQEVVDKTLKTWLNSTPDWLAYRMELAKELAIAAMSRKGCIDIGELMDDVDGIVERLKGGDK